MMSDVKGYLNTIITDNAYHNQNIPSLVIRRIRYIVTSKIVNTTPEI